MLLDNFVIPFLPTPAGTFPNISLRTSFLFAVTSFSVRAVAKSLTPQLISY